MRPTSGTSTPRTTSHQEPDTRHLVIRDSRPVSYQSLEGKNISDEGETSDEGEGGEYEEEEIAPEQLIPQYIDLQKQIYNLHPASTSLAQRKKGGKGPKQAKSPVELTPEKTKELKRLQDKLEALTRDPLFDIKESEYIWAEERLRLEKEGWIKKQLEGKRIEKNPKQPKPSPSQLSPAAGSGDEENDNGGVLLFLSSKSASAPLVEDDDVDLGLTGGLFEPPPTEEKTVGQTEEVEVAIRDFGEAESAGGNFGKKKPKGRAGVGLAKVKDILEEVCRSR